MTVIALAADHAGEPLLSVAREAVVARGLTPVRLGEEIVGPADDYPDFAELVARAIRSGEAARGILLCGSGVGASVAASKFGGVRAAVCHDTYSAAQGVEHDDMNVLCVGARVVGSALARAIFDAYLGASFTNEDRHVRRLAKVRSFEGGEAG